MFQAECEWKRSSRKNCKRKEKYMLEDDGPGHGGSFYTKEGGGARMMFKSSLCLDEGVKRNEETLLSSLFRWKGKGGILLNPIQSMNATTKTVEDRGKKCK
jgi:hypothetical protein